MPEWQERFGPPLRPAEVNLALRRYLAARTLGNWIVYFGDDIRILGRYLRLCLDVVELFASRPGTADRDAWLEAIRSSDLWLMHHCDPERIARNLR